MTNYLNNYKFLVDSIQLRYNENMMDEFAKYYIAIKDEDNHKWLYTDDLGNLLFEVRKHFDNFSILKSNYYIISFNGFYKYSERDTILKNSFLKVLEILKVNEVKFYLSGIDLCIDLKTNTILDLIGTKRKPKQGLSLYLIENLTREEIESINSNERNFEFGRLAKDKSKMEQRMYSYNKSIKEDLDFDIFRVEAKLKRFQKIEKNSSFEDYHSNLYEEILRRMNEYVFTFKGKSFEPDFVEVLTILKLCAEHTSSIQLPSILNTVKIISKEDNERKLNTVKILSILFKIVSPSKLVELLKDFYHYRSFDVLILFLLFEQIEMKDIKSTSVP